MKRALAVLLLAVAADAPAAGPPSGIERLAWLTGSWESASPTRVIQEQWMAPRARSMLVVGRTFRGDSLVEYELVVVREQGDRLAYEAHPSGQRSAVFLSRDVSDTSVVFENLEHDFPQRVGYVRAGADSVLVWIEGTRNGKLRRVEFPYRRADCMGR